MNRKDYEKLQDKQRDIDEFIGSISFSWTWDRLTEEERTQFKNWIHSDRYLDTIKGTSYQRFDIMNNFYFMFLLGLGYGKNKRFEP